MIPVKSAKGGVSLMKRYLFLLLIVCVSFVGCDAKDNAVKGQIDRKGFIIEIDVTGNRVLVDDPDNGLIWLNLPGHGDITKYEVDQEVVVWIGNGVKESSPAQAAALNIEIVGEKGVSLRPFDFSNQSFPPNPSGVVTIRETNYDMARGGFEWSRGNESVTTDALGPTQLAEKFEAIVVEANSNVTIVIEQNPILDVYIWGTDREDIHVDEGLISLPSASGRYIYEVVAKWTNGEASFTFVVEVK